MEHLYNIIVQSILILLCVGSAGAALVGAGLLFAPAKTLKLNAFMSKWIDTRRIRVELDRPRWVERLFYRWHRLAGALVVIGATYALYTLLLTPIPIWIGKLFEGDALGLWPAFCAFLVIGNVLAVFLGALVFARPSLIREIELAANRWISTEFLNDFFGAMHMSFELLLFRHLKKTGVFMFVSGIYVVLQIGNMLLHGDWKALL